MGMEAQGHECLGFCEIDKFARKSYKSIFQTEGEIEFHDIRDVSDDEFKNLEGKSMSSVGDSLVKHFQSQEDDWDLKILEELCSLKLLGRPNKSNHVFFFLKMLKAYSITIRDGRSPQYLPHLMSWGLMLSGRCLTVRILAFPKTERVFIIGHSRKKGTRLLFPFRREGQATNSETLKTLGNLNPSKSGMSGKVYYSEGFAPTLVRGKGEGFKVAIPCMTPDRLDKRQNSRRFKENQEPMFTLNTQDRHGIAVVGDLPTSFKETGRVYGSEGLSPTLTTMQGGDKIPKILIPEPIQFLKVREATKKDMLKQRLGIQSI
ncbi:modification methylase HpaII [Streptococcus pneumoniae GA47283]|nr:modification methylase HpaII [Streptococcus pneumoniae GA47283]